MHSYYYFVFLLFFKKFSAKKNLKNYFNKKILFENSIDSKLEIKYFLHIIKITLKIFLKWKKKKIPLKRKKKWKEKNSDKISLLRINKFLQINRNSFFFWLSFFFYAFYFTFVVLMKNQNYFLFTLFILLQSIIYCCSFVEFIFYFVLFQ